MPDFREATLILYSLLSMSPRLIISLVITICSITLATVTATIISQNIALIVFASGIVSFCSIFFLTRFFTPIFIPERNTKNCAAMASLTTMLLLFFMLFALFITPRILLFGLSLVFLISFIYFGIFSRAKRIIRLIVLLVQPTLVFLIYFQMKPDLLSSGIYIFNILIMSVGAIIVEKTMDAPMLHLINMIWNDGGRVLLSSLMNGNFSIEDGNPNLGEHTDLPIKVIKISDSTIVFPAIHPGPFGELGGARIPSVLSEKFKGKVFTLHTPTTHDFNPIRKEELNNIVDAINGAVFSEREVCSKLITKSNKQNNIKVHLQVFGKSEPVALMCLELQEGFGDIGFEMWELTNQMAKNFGYSDVFMVDAHNYYTKEGKSARLGTPTGDIIKILINEILEEGIKAPRYELEFAGVKQSVNFDENKGFGRDGIGAFAFRCGGENTVYLYIDGNSLLPEVNKRLTKILQDNFDHGIILTTDTHAVHTMGGGYNPVGKNVDVNELEKFTKKVLQELEFKPSIPKFASTTANVWIWSPDLGTRYLQALDTTLITAKWFLPSTLGLTLLCILLITLLA